MISMPLTSQGVPARWRRRAAVAAAALVLTAAAAAAQIPAASAQVPADGLRLEGEGRWRDALALYEPVVRDHPGRVDLWLRIADIHVRLGDVEAGLQALSAAVAARADDPALFARLSRAYAAANHPSPALLAIRGALALSPDEPALLRAAGDLALWNGEYAEARTHYQALLRAEPGETPAWLALARACAWDGATDEAVGAYRAYVERAPRDPAGWLEWARTESWRGNDAGAAAVLARYRDSFPETPAYRTALTSVTLRGGRPGRALQLVRPLRADGPLDYELHLLEGLAHVGRGDARRAHEALGKMRLLAPERRETAGLASQLRAAFGSALQPGATVYSDSDGLRTSRLPAAVSLALAPELRVTGGYERHDLRARAASGLDRVDGGTTTLLEHVWGGTELRLAPATVLRAQGGRQYGHGRGEWTYGAGVALRLGDRARVAVDHEHGMLAISPRTVSLGLLRDATRARISLRPSYRFFLDAEGSIERISDDNVRRSLVVTPRVATIRTQRLNLDLGVSAYRFSADMDLNHGYYDPALYESYSVVVLPYVKFSENTGLSLMAQAGAQRDERQPGFEPGGSAAAELTVGIYQAWVLKVNGSWTHNTRLESGAFRGYSGGIGLSRRF